MAAEAAVHRALRLAGRKRADIEFPIIEPYQVI
jgi:hypothetical protein